MKLGMQSGNAYGAPTLASGVPAVLPTNPNQSFAKLIVKGELGQIVQQWLVLQNKCTLGSASSCALRCQLPGVAPYHALLVMGSRQVFIRALAPKLSRNGVMVNELLLTDEQNSFEVAGHLFELIRTTKTTDSNSSSNERLPASKLKFTLARTMDTNPNRVSAKQPEPIASPIQAVQPLNTDGQFSAIAQNTAAQSKWIGELIQSAMLPLARQLQEMTEPLEAVQSELNRRARRKREQRKSVAQPTVAAVVPVADASNLTTQIDVQSQVAHLPEPIMVPIISPLVEEQLTRQSTSLANLNDRLAELKSNLYQLERTVADSVTNAPQPIAAEPSIVPVISPVVEAQLAQQSDSLLQLNDRLNGVTQNIGSLERIVSENFVTVINATSTPAPVPAPIDLEPVNQALLKITSVAEQIQGLNGQLNEVRTNLTCLERIVSENLASTNDLKSLPAPAGSEALQQLANVTDQLSRMLQELNQRQAAIEESDEAWREQMRSQLTQLQSSVSATESSLQNLSERSLSNQIAIEQQVTAPKGTCPTSAALISNGHLRPTTPVRRESASGESAISATPAPEADAPVRYAPLSLPSASIIAASTFVEEVVEPVANQVADDLPIQSESQVEIRNEFVGFDSASVQESQIGFDSQAAWQATAATTIDSATITEAPQPAPVESEWDAKSDSEWAVNSTATSVSDFKFESENSNFIEEKIEEGPVETQAAVSELPSWWTDDDKTIYQDDSSASASLDPTWNMPASAPPQSEDAESIAALINSFANGNSANSSETELPQLSSLSNWGVDATSPEDPEFDSAASNVGTIAGIPFDELVGRETGKDDLAEDESEAINEQQELSSLLERFGLVRETNDESVNDDRGGMIDSYSPVATSGFQTRDNVEESRSEFIEESETFGETTGSQLDFQAAIVEPPAEPEFATPSPAISSSSSSVADEGSEEESIEDYMKRLMARMRGGSVEEEAKSTAASTAASMSSASAAKPASEPVHQSNKIALPAAATERTNASTTSPFNPEEYVPKALAPEKARNMAAMRELANTSARSAIQVSARRRYGTAIAMKLAIALTGLGVGATLVMINGLNVNIGLIATIASFLVALIWGFDAITTIRPLLFAPVETKNVEQVVVEEPLPE